MSSCRRLYPMRFRLVSSFPPSLPPPYRGFPHSPLSPGLRCRPLVRGACGCAFSQGAFSEHSENLSEAASLVARKNAAPLVA
eukprot:1321584-Pyramimonas_sp.AAC.1